MKNIRKVEIQSVITCFFAEFCCFVLFFPCLWFFVFSFVPVDFTFTDNFFLPKLAGVMPAYPVSAYISSQASCGVTALPLGSPI